MQMLFLEEKGIFNDTLQEVTFTEIGRDLKVRCAKGMNTLRNII